MRADKDAGELLKLAQRDADKGRMTQPTPVKDLTAPKFYYTRVSQSRSRDQMAPLKFVRLIISLGACMLSAFLAVL